MGGGPAKERMLITLPMKEPTELVERLRSKFPHIDITFKNVSYTKDKAQHESEIPSGKLSNPISLAHAFSTFSPSSPCH